MKHHGVGAGSFWRVRRGEGAGVRGDGSGWAVGAPAIIDNIELSKSECLKKNMIAPAP